MIGELLIELLKLVPQYLRRILHQVQLGYHAGKVIQSKGNCVELSDGRIIHRHGDHVRTRLTSVDQTPNLPTATDTDDLLMDPGVPSVQLPVEPPDAAINSSVTTIHT